MKILKTTKNRTKDNTKLPVQELKYDNSFPKNRPINFDICIPPNTICCLCISLYTIYSVKSSAFELLIQFVDFSLAEMLYLEKAARLDSLFISSIILF